MNVTLLSPWDGNSAGTNIACTLYEGHILLAEGIAAAITQATVGNTKGKRSTVNGPIAK